MKKLILTEKPSVARDFAKALNVNNKQDGFFESEQYVITWAIGHLLQLKSPEDYDQKWKKWQLENLPILPTKFEYKGQAKTKKQLDIVVRQLKRSDIDEIIVATDAGREGELIARNLITRSGVKRKMYRFWTSQALSSKVIIENIKSAKPLEEYDRLYKAGRCRQGADWLVGMNLSRLATIKMGDLFSIGRVQTAVLGLIVSRRKEIDNFKPEPFFVIKGTFSFESAMVDALWFDPLKKENQNKIDSEEACQKVFLQCQGKEVVVDNIKKSEKRQTPPQLFSLTELQKVANRKYGFTANHTLNIAQSLYEKYKCLSYPRTDARVLGSQIYSQVESLLDKFKTDHEDLFQYYDAKKVSLSNRQVFDDSKLTDHHALIPLKSFSGGCGTDEGKIFNLVLKRFIAVFCKDYVFEETNLNFIIAKNYFKTKGQQIVCMGWRAIEDKESEVVLPPLIKGQVGEIAKLKYEKKFTKPPFEYSEALLLQDMINPSRLVEDREYKRVFRTEVGLGTQATRAQIIETLIDRNYISRENRVLRATLKGIKLIDTLTQLKFSSSLAKPEETAKWEMELEKISQGNGDEVLFAQNIIQFIKDATSEWIEANDIERVKVREKSSSSKYQSKKVSVVGVCPFCGSQILSYPKSYGCSKWKDGCKFTVWKKIAGKAITPAIVKDLIASGKSSKLKGFKSKQGKFFEATLIMDNNNVRFEF